MMLKKTFPQISWTQFEACNPAPQTAFENMCRILFNHSYFDGAKVFHSNPNNPGIEIEPVMSQDEQSGSIRRISFQAKYFTSNAKYDQIAHSVDKAVGNYSGKLDELYLYCNKDLDTTCNSYTSIESMLTAAGIKLILVSNRAILDLVTENAPVAWYYFDFFRLTPDWFAERLEISLKSLGPRYNGVLNVETSAETDLDIFLHDADGIAYINEMKSNVLKHLSDMYIPLEFVPFRHHIRAAVERIADITCGNIKDCLLWDSLIENACADEFALISANISTLEKDLHSDLDPETYSKKRSKLNILQELLVIPSMLKIMPHTRNLITQKVLFIRGNAGVGKSHLMGTVAKKNLALRQFSVFVLGNCYLSNELATKQTPTLLGLNDDFDCLLNKLECVAMESGNNACLFIDAINESIYKDIWKTELQSIISQINKRDHVKLVISIRSGYEPLVLDETIRHELEHGNLANITHFGFQEETANATKEFLNFYGIPFSPTYFLHHEMTNPLFLTLFCKYHNENEINLFSLFGNLISRAEEEAFKFCGISGVSSVLQYLIEDIARLRLANGAFNVSKRELLMLDFWDVNGLSSFKLPFLAALERSGLIISNVNKGDEICYIGYNLLEDYICAKTIIKDYPEKNSLFVYLRDELLAIHDGVIRKYYNLDIFVIVCGLTPFGCGEECIYYIAKDTLDDDFKRDISERYVESFVWRNSNSISYDAFIDFANKYSVAPDIVFRVLIENSTKERHPLNANALHKILISKSLPHRDFLWTTYINGLAHEDERIFQLISLFYEGNLLDGLSKENTQLLLLLLTWFLTSSNRVLRDKASKAAIELLKENFNLAKPLLTHFKDVNDPYVAQRLYGVIFGACMKRTDNSIDILKELALYIYETIFDREFVYPDILLRDYARLIIERYMFESGSTGNFIDTSKIRPPYRSIEIPVVERIEYGINTDRHHAVHRIDRSMWVNHPDCPGMYGDFGRYVFQSALEQFEGIDIVNLYHYAMQFILNELGYSDELFGEYDSSTGYIYRARHENKKLERIGKKYQWIAFYNILARTADTHLLKSYNSPSYPFEGPWDPYVRDFDPTVNVNFLISQSLPNIQFPEENKETFMQLGQSHTKEEIQLWTRTASPLFTNIKSNLILHDTNGYCWAALTLNQRIENELSGDKARFNSGFQDVWLNSYAYFVRSSELLLFENHLSSKNLVVNSFPETATVYSIFNREAPWAPGYKSVFKENWIERELENGKEHIVKHFGQVPCASFNEDNELIVEYFEKEWTETIMDKGVVGLALPSFSFYLWEEEYDSSQPDNTAFFIPCREILDTLGLEQKKYDGYFYNQSGDIVAFDASLSGLGKTLLIRKDYLDMFLEEQGLCLFWVCTGEKQYFYGEHAQEWQEWSGFLYLDGNDIVGEIGTRECH